MFVCMRFMRNMYNGAMDWYVDMARLEASVRRNNSERYDECKFPCQLWMRYQLGMTGRLARLEVVQGVTNGFGPYKEWYALRKAKQCVVCDARTRTKCTGCNSVYYCSTSCQEQDWGAHQIVCKPRNRNQLRERLLMDME